MVLLHFTGFQEFFETLGIMLVITLVLILLSKVIDSRTS